MATAHPPFPLDTLRRAAGEAAEGYRAEHSNIGLDPAGEELLRMWCQLATVAGDAAGRWSAAAADLVERIARLTLHTREPTPSVLVDQTLLEPDGGVYAALHQAIGVETPAAAPPSVVTGAWPQPQP